MEKFWIVIIALSIFLLSNFIFWRITAGHRERKYDEKSWKLRGERTFFWQGAIYVSTGVTILILFLLKWAEILKF
ncbi:hypothetical protein [Christiangramia aquimixticola]|uniref:hypothetical protein n=1 Tax=Christiangramia aquimixticola TaxID=1697558 RepID=UPI003AA84AF3